MFFKDCLYFPEDVLVFAGYPDGGVVDDGDLSVVDYPGEGGFFDGLGKGGTTLAICY